MERGGQAKGSRLAPLLHEAEAVPGPCRSDASREPLSRCVVEAPPGPCRSGASRELFRSAPPPPNHGTASSAGAVIAPPSLSAAARGRDHGRTRRKARGSRRSYMGAKPLRAPAPATSHFPSTSLKPRRNPVGATQVASLYPGASLKPRRNPVGAAQAASFYPSTSLKPRWAPVGAARAASFFPSTPQITAPPQAPSPSARHRRFPLQSGSCRQP